jgi:hypothetical protein
VGVSISWNSRDCIDISRYVVFYSSGDVLTVSFLPTIPTSHPLSPSTFTYPSCHRALAPLACRIPSALEYTMPSNTHSARILVFHKQDWHGIFLRFDRDNSGTIDRKELHAALLGFGFSLPPEMVKRLEKRFAPPPQPGLEHQKRGISFDRFLLACVTVKHYTEAFRK